MNRRQAGPRGFPTEVTQTENGVILRVPLGTGEELVGWLSMEYRREDPLTVNVAVRAPSRAAVLERMLLRSDVRAAQTVGVRYADLVIEPASLRGFLSFQFEERHVIVTALVPTDVIVQFVRATDDVLPPGRAETEAVSAALADLLQDRSA